MKAQVLNKYDDDLTASSWVDMQDVPDDANKSRNTSESKFHLTLQ